MSKPFPFAIWQYNPGLNKSQEIKDSPASKFTKLISTMPGVGKHLSKEDLTNIESSADSLHKINEYALDHALNWAQQPDGWANPFDSPAKHSEYDPHHTVISSIIQRAMKKQSTIDPSDPNSPKPFQLGKRMPNGKGLGLKFIPSHRDNDDRIKWHMEVHHPGLKEPAKIKLYSGSGLHADLRCIPLGAAQFPDHAGLNAVGSSMPGGLRNGSPGMKAGYSSGLGTSITSGNFTDPNEWGSHVASQLANPSTLKRIYRGR